MKNDAGLSDRRGFSLIEMIIAIGVLSIVFAVVASLYIQSGETTVLVRDRSDAIFEAQEAVERMVDAVRNSDGLSTLDSNSFTVVNGANSATFTYDGSQDVIMRDDQVYASGITAAQFIYMDRHGTTTSTPDEVEKMSFDITATSQETSKEITTEVFIRRKA